jgi:hypothetical protein
LVTVDSGARVPPYDGALAEPSALNKLRSSIQMDARAIEAVIEISLQAGPVRPGPGLQCWKNNILGSAMFRTLT